MFFGILVFLYFGILVFWYFVILLFCYFVILVFWDFGILVERFGERWRGLVIGGEVVFHFFCCCCCCDCDTIGLRDALHLKINSEQTLNGDMK